MEYYRKILLLFYVYIIAIFIISPSMAAENETEEDIVGDILEKEGVSRNPPEASGSIASVPETSGQISSFDEGPVVVQNSTQNGTIN